jgi:Ser/Thr protein kinase RdoA (MazF antagonist)
VFGELTHDEATEPELRRAEQLLEAVASAIRGFQLLPLRMGPRNSFARLYAEQEHNLAYLKLCEPALAEQIAAIRAELARLEPRTEVLPSVFCHGDFAHGNVIIDGGAVGIVDLDKVGSAEPVYDVAYFLTHMWSFGVRHPRRRPHVERLWRHFREAYLALAPEVPRRRLALYEALDFAAYVLRNFRKQSHQANWLIWAQGQINAAWARLEEAAGPGGGQP